MPIKAIRYLIISTIRLGRSFTLPPPIGLQIVESVPQLAVVDVGVVEEVVEAAGVAVEVVAVVVASACATFAAEKIGAENGMIKIAAANKIGVARKQANRKYFFIMMLIFLK
jgi:hypothetical protein